MRYAKTLVVVLWGVLMLAGCASLQSGDSGGKGESATAETYRITGSVTYRERIPLPPKSVVTVTLEDISIADRPAERLAEETIQAGRHQVPIKFALYVDPARLQDNHRYGVRATIRDVRGNLLWTTDTTHSIDPQQGSAEMGSLVLVRVSGS
ncbi:YbaY family lipoprotein [Marinobacter zhejiangensis]|uniref:Putative lipoprotein n=1 Tax=Marinobacter zhejiangensis TaxID=488535 RepID=A0A1I4L353_9GAMM|nr:YbaY family lipoprotein [Marinobacter zhejiangensis]SFL85259.1 putative lipoprotein [Marinobacter zhejiangensis]